MKPLLLWAALLLTIQATAQSAAFIELEKKVNEHACAGRWDEVLLAATDLLSEEPTRGEGYYYAALAFQRLGRPEEAAEYIKSAEASADEELKKKIVTLKEAIQSTRTTQQLSTGAEQQQSSGNSGKAAAEWVKAWQVDKKKIAYALNAVDIYVSERKWDEALAILNDPALKSDPGAQQVALRILETPDMKKLTAYRTAVAGGASEHKAGRYSAAISQYTEALKLFPGDGPATEGLRSAQDELAWQQAGSTNTIASFEAYLAGVTLKRHRNEAIDILQRSLIKHGTEAAAKGDIQNMEYFLNKYLSDYPSGASAAQARATLCTAYLKAARQSAGGKTASAQATALDFFGRADGTCAAADKKYGAEVARAKKLQTRFGRPDRAFLAYQYDTLMPIGLAIGSTNNRSVGMYLKGRANTDFFTAGGYFDVDNSFQNNSNRQATGVVRDGQAELLLGLTKKITHPLWIYAGGGVNARTVYWEVDTYSNGQYDETNWAKNTDESRIVPVAEGGIMLSLGGLHLSAGVRSPELKGIYYTAGIGFSWGK